MTNLLSFKVSEVFPADDPVRVAQVRFLIASRAFTAFVRIFPPLGSGSGFRDSTLYLLAFSVGAANEAANAFMDVDALNGFHELLGSGWTGMSERIEALRQECDEKNPSSLRKRLMLITRNTLAFHWDRKIIERALVRIAEDEIPLWGGTDEENVDPTVFPVVGAVIRTGLESLAGSKGELTLLGSQLAHLNADLAHVAAAVYSAAQGGSTEKASSWEAGVEPIAGADG